MAVLSARAEIIPKAYALTEIQYGIPEGLLYAMALTESGRQWAGRSVAWPWTLNVSGQAHYYDSKAAMQAGLRHWLTKTHSIDIGPLQVNAWWQRDKIHSPFELTHLWRNLSVAGEILKAQYDVHNRWFLAVGAYHAPSHPKRAEAYAQKVYQRWQSFSE